jgi:hypothetical protein
MLSFATLVLDEFVVLDRATSASFNDLLGSADALAVHLIATNEKLQGETEIAFALYESGNSRDWVIVGQPWTGFASENASFIFRFDRTTGLAFARFLVAVGSPGCHVRLYAAGLNYAAQVSAPALTVPGRCGC